MYIQMLTTSEEAERVPLSNPLLQQPAGGGEAERVPLSNPLLQQPAGGGEAERVEIWIISNANEDTETLCFA